MNCAAAARRSASETVRPSSPSGSVGVPDGLSTRVGGVPAMASAPNRPSSVGPLMSEMIAGGAFQAISGRRRKLDGREQPALHVGEQRLLVFLALDVGLAGRAQVLARARDRERLLAVDVMRARAQAQRVAAADEAAVQARDDAAAGVGDAAHRVDQLGKVFEVDFHDVVDRDIEQALDHRDRQRRPAELVRGVDLLQAVSGYFDDRVARNRQTRRVTAAGADQHDRVRAPEAGRFGARFAAVLLAAVGAEHEDVVGRRERIAGRVEHAPTLPTAAACARSAS